MRRVVCLLLLATACVKSGPTHEQFVDAQRCAQYGLDDIGVMVAAILRGLDGPDSMDEPVEFAVGSPHWLEEDGNLGRLFGEITGDERADGFRVGETATFDLLVSSENWNGSAEVTIERQVDGTLRMTGEMRISAPDCLFTASELDIVVDPDTDDGAVRPTGTMEVFASDGIWTSRLALFVPGTGGGSGPQRVVRGMMTFDGTTAAVLTGTFAGEPTSFRVDYDWRG